MILINTLTSPTKDDLINKLKNGEIKYINKILEIVINSGMHDMFWYIIENHNPCLETIFHLSMNNDCIDGVKYAIDKGYIITSVDYTSRIGCAISLEIKKYITDVHFKQNDNIGKIIDMINGIFITYSIKLEMVEYWIGKLPDYENIILKNYIDSVLYRNNYEYALKIIEKHHDKITSKFRVDINDVIRHNATHEIIQKLITIGYVDCSKISDLSIMYIIGHYNVDFIRYITPHLSDNKKQFMLNACIDGNNKYNNHIIAIISIYEKSHPSYDFTNTLHLAIYRKIVKVIEYIITHDVNITYDTTLVSDIFSVCHRMNEHKLLSTLMQNSNLTKTLSDMDLIIYHTVLNHTNNNGVVSIDDFNLNKYRQ